MRYEFAKAEGRKDRDKTKHKQKLARLAGCVPADGRLLWPAIGLEKLSHAGTISSLLVSVGVALTTFAADCSFSRFSSSSMAWQQQGP